MSWLALAYALQHGDARDDATAATSGWFQTGRIVDEPAVHVGVRPAAECDPEGGLNWAVGATVQITVNVL